MQHRRSHQILRVRVQTIQYPPLEPLHHPSHELHIHRAILIHKPKDTLSFSWCTANLLPPLEKVFPAELGTFHVFVELHGKLKSQRLERTGEVGYADGGRVLKDVLRFKHYGLLGLAFRWEGSVW